MYKVFSHRSRIVRYEQARARVQGPQRKAYVVSSILQGIVSQGPQCISFLVIGRP